MAESQAACGGFSVDAVDSGGSGVSWPFSFSLPR
jgi:hypothetical protein